MDSLDLEKLEEYIYHVFLTEIQLYFPHESQTLWHRVLRKVQNPGRCDKRAKIEVRLENNPCVSYLPYLKFCPKNCFVPNDNF